MPVYGGDREAVHPNNSVSLQSPDSHSDGAELDSTVVYCRDTWVQTFYRNGRSYMDISSHRPDYANASQRKHQHRLFCSHLIDCTNMEIVPTPHSQKSVLTVLTWRLLIYTYLITCDNFEHCIFVQDQGSRTPSEEHPLSFYTVQAEFTLFTESKIYIYFINIMFRSLHLIRLDYTTT